MFTIPSLYYDLSLNGEAAVNGARPTVESCSGATIDLALFMDPGSYVLQCYDESTCFPMGTLTIILVTADYDDERDRASFHPLSLGVHFPTAIC